MESYPVVLSVDDKTGEYSKFAGTVLASIFANTKSKIQVHLFHSENLSRENKEKFQELCKLFHQKLKFHFIQLDENIKTINVIENGFLSEGTLYRLFIAERLTEEHRALYLDCDLIVDGDIKEIFSIGMEGKTVCAVHDVEVERNYSFFRKNIVPSDKTKYFNAGVMLFDLEKTRKGHKLLEECLKILEKYPRDPFGDQSPLNSIFKNECLLIDRKYNRFPKRDSKRGEALIWHFAGANKPWQTKYSEIDQLFWKYLKMTPWGKDEEKVRQMQAQVVDSLDYALLHYPSGSKRAFFKSTGIRVYREIREIMDKYF